MEEVAKLNVAYIKKCDMLYECPNGCNDEESYCEAQAFVMIPVDEVELENDTLRARLQFGTSDPTDPWTDRQLERPLVPLPRKSVRIFSRQA